MCIVCLLLLEYNSERMDFAYLLATPHPVPDPGLRAKGCLVSVCGKDAQVGLGWIHKFRTQPTEVMAEPRRKDVIT